MAVTGIRLEGVERVIGRFEFFDRKMRKSIMRKAVRAGGSPFLKTARAKAPVGNSLLKRSLVQLIRVYNGSVWAIIGQEKTRGFNKQKVKIERKGGLSGRGELTPIHLVEESTQPHTIPGSTRSRMSGKRAKATMRLEFGGEVIYRGRVRHPGTRGKHFIRAAATEAEKQSLAGFEAKLVEEVMREA